MMTRRHHEDSETIVYTGKNKCTGEDMAIRVSKIVGSKRISIKGMCFTKKQACYLANKIIELTE